VAAALRILLAVEKVLLVLGVKNADRWWSNHQVIRGEVKYLKSTMAFSSPVKSFSSKSAPVRCTSPWYS
jgi:hypothetical protein